MAGHFILRSITVSDKQTALTKGGSISGRMHAGVGWNTASRDVLTNAFGGGNIGNRNGLPPHIYLQFAATVAGSAQDTYLNACGWAENLTRPAAAGLGLRALCPLAQNAWDAGNLNNALKLQSRHGAMSIEIYYEAGYEI